MPTEFINTCRTSGGDYSNPTVWETQTEGDYTTGAFLVFAISASVGTLSDNDSVVGGTSGATGTVIATPTSTQILVQVATGTFQSGENIELSTDSGVYVTTSDAGDIPIPTLVCEAGATFGNIGLVGSTNSATYPGRRIRSDTPGQKFTIQNLGNGTGFRHNDAYGQCEDIYGITAGTTNSDEPINITQNFIIARRCFGEQTAGVLGTGTYGFEVTGNNCEIYSCGCKGGPTGGLALTGSDDLTVSNFTSHGSEGVGVTSNAGADRLTLNNIVSYGHVGNDWDIDLGSDIDEALNNAGETGTIPDTGSSTAVTLTGDPFVDAANDNFAPLQDYLGTDGVDDYIALDTLITLSGDYKITMGIEVGSVGSANYLFGSAGDNVSRVFPDNNELKIRDVDNSTAVFGGTPLAAGGTYDLVIERTGGTTSLVVNGDSFGVSVGAPGDIPIDQIFRRFATVSNAANKLFYLKIDGEVELHPDNISGTDWTDSLGLNDATIIGGATKTTQSSQIREAGFDASAVVTKDLYYRDFPTTYPIGAIAPYTVSSGGGGNPELGTASETDSAGGFTRSVVGTLGTATEADSANAFSAPVKAPLATSGETDTAGGFTAPLDNLWTPEYVDNLAWWDASDADTITESGNLGTQLDDKSGNGHHAVSSGVERPTTNVTTQNGLNVLDFDGTAQQLNAGNLGGKPASFGFFLVGWTSNTGKTNQGFASSGPANGATADIWPGVIHRSDNVGDIEAIIGDGTDFQYFETTDAPISQGNASIIYVEYIDGDAFITIRVNGDIRNVVDNGGTGTENSGTAYDFVLGNLGLLNSSNFHLQGSIGEIAIPDRILSQAERQQYEGYLAHKWGLEGNLASGHPYKNAPPTVNVGPFDTANESDSAGAFTSPTAGQLGTASEVDTAGFFDRSVVGLFGTSFEVDAAGAFAIPGGFATSFEVDSAGEFTKLLPAQLGTASENDSAGLFKRTPTLGTASELDTSNAFTLPNVAPLGTAYEIDGARLFKGPVRGALVTAVEIDESGPMYAPGKVVGALGRAVEIDTSGSFANVAPPEWVIYSPQVSGVAGSVVTAYAEATNNSDFPTTYQWFNPDGTEIQFATGTTYRRELQLSDDGQNIRVVATNAGGSIERFIPMEATQPDAGYVLRLGKYREPFFKNGTVVLDRPLLEGERISIERKTPIENVVLFDAEETPDWNAFEYALDRHMMICQEIEGHLCSCEVCITPVAGDVRIFVNLDEVVNPEDPLILEPGDFVELRVPITEGTKPFTYEWTEDDVPIEDGVDGFFVLNEEEQTAIFFTVQSGISEYKVIVGNECGPTSGKAVIATEINVSVGTGFNCQELRDQVLASGPGTWFTSTADGTPWESAEYPFPVGEFPYTAENRAFVRWTAEFTVGTDPEPPFPGQTGPLDAGKRILISAPDENPYDACEAFNWVFRQSNPGFGFEYIEEFIDPLLLDNQVNYCIGAIIRKHTTVVDTVQGQMTNYREVLQFDRPGSSPGQTAGIVTIMDAFGTDVGGDFTTTIRPRIAGGNQTDIIIRPEEDGGWYPVHFDSELEYYTLVENANGPIANLPFKARLLMFRWKFSVNGIAGQLESLASSINLDFYGDSADFSNVQWVGAESQRYVIQNADVDFAAVFGGPHGSFSYSDVSEWYEANKLPSE